MAGREDLVETALLPEEMRNRYACRSGDDATAMDEILTKAANHTLVIINEDHAKPRHRLFIRNLALRLRRLGFTHYAAETFSTSIVDGTGYPQLGEGLYTSEPMFAPPAKAWTSFIACWTFSPKGGQTDWGGTNSSGYEYSGVARGRDGASTW